MTQSIMKINDDGDNEWWFNGVEAPWLEESLKTKVHLDETLSKIGIH